MKFLALVLGHATGRQPATDRLHPLYLPTVPGRQRKRDRILEELLPLPEQLDLRRLRTFKERHAELLARFRTQVELLVLDDGIAPDTPLFALRLEELRHRRDELAARMNEGRLGRVLFGTVCGMFGAAHALASDTTPAALIGGLPASPAPSTPPSATAGGSIPIPQASNISCCSTDGGNNAAAPKSSARKKSLQEELTSLRSLIPCGSVNYDDIVKKIDRPMPFVLAKRPYKRCLRALAKNKKTTLSSGRFSLRCRGS